jgi:hypothetical protein
MFGAGWCGMMFGAGWWKNEGAISWKISVGGGS